MITEKATFDLYKKVSTELPTDVMSELVRAHDNEEDGSLGKESLGHMIDNAKKAAELSRPMCQDTGTPFFYVNCPKECSQKEIKEAIEKATAKATEEVPLRPNAVDTLTDKNVGNMPVIHFTEGNELKVGLLMKGGGSENVSTVYKLPDASIGAGRDLEGVRRCVLDAVFKAQGKGCPPYSIGVATGGSIEEAAHLSKMQLLRKVDDINEEKALSEFEEKTLRDVNNLGIGPMGLGGKSTAISLKAAAGNRHPATYFVGISFGCWCMRRGQL